MHTAAWIRIFQQSIEAYHKTDNVDTPLQNPYTKGTLEFLMYEKNWIDTVQWHLEDIIRDPQIDPVKALEIKRRIDSSNQHRTDMVEYIDSWFLQQYREVQPEAGARFNTESPAWAIDRLSILELKIYHMNLEATRTDASEAHREACAVKLQVLHTQRDDLSTAIDQLLTDIEAGRKYMKIYKQMKMYNDESLNPVLYQKK
ncbi:DUF4254 domain-containing protein [Niabella beijingensis]|uniref:DUF4254 domain-containing protein n=1 Tax=Niabella beijingensis TaxID=2872700 RepID=UPI001CBD3BFD|nr:DUF4254 domain-containing protein [Niabella beijingensis]MBZ4191667.1 DUF4254 domain-containing protein [Niabella beijingensis]